MKKIGILGGTFDPIHNGHIELAKWSLIEKNLDFVFFMPTKKNPFKKGREMAADEHRANMIKLISKENASYCLLDKELNDKEFSYTYETLSKLKEEYIDCQIYFIMGTDSMLSLENWRNGQELLNEFKFITCDRPGHSECELVSKVEEYRKKYNADIYILAARMPDISSTDIKERVKNHRSITDLVPESVERYIIENDLYR